MGLHAVRNRAFARGHVAAKLFSVGPTVPADICGPDYGHLTIDREFAEMVLHALFQRPADQPGAKVPML